VNSLPLGNTYWVQPGRWLSGEYPGAASRDALEARVAALVELGIDAFVDLTAPGEMPPYDSALPAQVRHIRKPIPDHGTPLEPAHMQEILATIDALLAEGRTVYLHCRAGIGRTGMVVGCHLADRGLRGDALVDALQALWATSPRSASWPFIPETEEQRAYVIEWPVVRDPTLDDEAMAATRALRDRFLGALVGLAVGDALAAATQLRRPGTFAPVADVLGGGPHDLPRGGWSDDTAMALCAAESLLESGGFDARDQMERLVRWQREGHLSATGQCVGITSSVAKALASAMWKRRGFAGSHDPGRLDPEVLPRSGGAVLFEFADRTRAIELAESTARLTCQAPMALEATRSLASSVHAALSGRPKPEVIAAAALIEPPLRTDVAAVAAGGWREALMGPVPAHATAPEALGVALACFDSTGSFRDAALLAANRGRDADVYAATCGLLAGAHYGALAIPPAWRKSLLRGELIEATADRLLAWALEGLADT
jgi:ADP-ribosyl-[dinitrogen reductase] hydrolase